MSSSAADASASSSPSSSSSSSTSSPPLDNSNVSSSCKKCVKVLQDLVSGLKDSKQGEEPPPLTLLKAIAGDQSHKLRIENSQDGVTIHFPVEITPPNLLRRWTNFTKEDANTTGLDDLRIPPHTLATSALETPPAAGVSEADPGPQKPLTIELKCRKCSSSGPEGGARAFLMGPTPLSVVLCHNRIQGDRGELSEILTHELVHLYDVQKSQLDLQQCENLAYSEIRAAKAAECRNSWKQLQPFCVKQKAICATNNLFPSEGRRCVQKVFSRAFGDNQPFKNIDGSNV